MSGPKLTSNQKGQFAELLVAANLAERGYRVSFAPAGCRYDLVVDIDRRFFRVQVKSSAKTSDNDRRYIFWTSSNKRYEKGDFDLIACVALDLKIVAYLPPHYLENKGKVSLRPPEAIKAQKSYRDFTINECTLEKALREIYETTKI